MSNLHPKLNWEDFQKARARRKRRRWLWWFVWLSTSACIAGLVVVQFTGTQVPVAEKAPLGVAEAFPNAPAAAEHPDAASQNTANSPVTPAPAAVAPQSNTSKVGALPTEGIEAKARPSEQSAANSQASVKANKSDSQTASSGLEATRPANAVPTGRTSSGSALQNSLAEMAALNQTASRSQEAAPAVPQIEKMALRKGPVLPRQPLAMPQVLVLAREVDLSARPASSDLPKTPKLPAQTPIWLSVAWSPWHGSEFVTPALAATNELNYRPLNSAQVVLRLQLSTFSDFTLSLEPQFINQRFQTQFNGQLATTVYAPGTIIGYLQTIKGVEAIVSDSVPGTSNITLRQNGVQQEFSLPLTLGYTLWRKGDFRVLTSASLGLHYRARYTGSWFDGQQLVALEEVTGKFGLLAAGSIAMHYQPGRISYSCGWVTAYRSTLRADQPALRNQVWIGVSVPLKR